MRGRLDSGKSERIAESEWVEIEAVEIEALAPGADLPEGTRRREGSSARGCRTTGDVQRIEESEMAETEPLTPGADMSGPRWRDDTLHVAPPEEAAPELPGCRPIRLTRDDLEDFEGRLEYWEASTETAWVVAEPTSAGHEGPARRLGRLAELIAAVRGSPIESYGSMDLVLLDEHGKWRRMMQADETLYLHPGRAHIPEVRLVVGEHDLPDVTLEVDYSTDVRSGKLGLYKRWGFPEIWVEVPARYRTRRRPGLTIHVREGDGYREAPESRAFPGWTAAEIHTALARKPLSAETHRVLERVGRRLGAREGTGPDDSPLMRSLRDEARASVLAEAVRSVLRGRGIGMPAGLAGEIPSWSGVSQHALISAAMSCEDEADFRARLRNMQAPEDGGGDWPSSE